MSQTSSVFPTIASLEDELAAFHTGLAVLAEETVSQGAGSRMLALPENEMPSWRAVRPRIRSTRIGALLPVWFKYGYEGIVAAGFDAARFDAVDGPFERLADMLGVLRTDDGYFEDCLLVADVDPDKRVHGHLADLVRRVRARHALDHGISLSLEELALLADMNERSVRNAVSAEGDGRLTLDNQGEVANEEASRWLRGRRGFIATQRRELPRDLKEPSAALDAIEIPGFLRSRLEALGSQPEDEMTAADMQRPAWFARAVRAARLSVERLDVAIRLPLDILPEECADLARAAEIDLVWLNHQVMTALFPDQVDMLLNPKAWRADEASVASEPASQAVTIELTASMLAHGYIDLPASSKEIFPADCFGTRTKGDEGAQVELVYGAHRAMTDIRKKSTKTISPRRRFTAWLNTELGAKPGDRIRLEKTAERVFTLTHIAH